ncbi:hypothetical protein GQ43DRAFT_186462 [Delitschia confertaspora ATCC 74209]|uniref:C2H2-type domain-containing protein n=1 Tax=Delitschia confertaspora ATCC 74209 TaxID=1513339 RepID=A0A9P4JH20_9PLEO|nr:hypothetical protein GQ43DRAFT_186462 [Delitschia confertaspora ATCC 74209]
MVDYAYPPTMSHDFELYPNQDPQLDYMTTTQPYIHSNTYMDPSAFTSSYEPMPMPALSDAHPRIQDLQPYYDGIALGVKPNMQYSPMGSPSSASHSFDHHPPILSASSESGASVSSSAMGSPSLNPQYDASWNAMNGHGLAPSIVQNGSGYEYDALAVSDKLSGCVGESPISSSFQSPATSTSSKWSSSLSMRRSPLTSGVHPGRKSPLLSKEIRPHHIPRSSSVACLPSSLSTSVPDMPENPNLIQPFSNSIFPQSPYPPEIRTTPSPYFPNIGHPPSPALSHVSSRSQRPGSKHFKRSSQSPYLHTQGFQPYPNFNGARRRSDASMHSQHSHASRKSGSSYELDDETREKGMCPLPECGRVFKDLKAHMLTHQNERPEKCPITTCEYHIKGFARKYDKNRHTLTHYKGTMVCGFCPGSGSAAEKSFNRADVFKRHLTSVHGVEQNPPNSRKKSPTGRKGYSGSPQNMTGTCSTCSVTFANAQEFYEHLDDCVLRVVQQADPSEAINQKLLNSVADDKDVAETMDRNGLSSNVDYSVTVYDEDDEDEDEEIDVDDQNDDTYGVRRSRSGKGSIKNTKHH